MATYDWQTERERFQRWHCSVPGCNRDAALPYGFPLSDQRLCGRHLRERLNDVKKAQERTPDSVRTSHGG